MLARILNDSGLGRGTDDVLRPMVASTGDTSESDMLLVEVPISGVAEASRVERRLRVLLSKLAKSPPRSESMKRAFERERELFWTRFESPQHRALTLARSEARRGDARHALRALAELERVRAEDVSRVAAAYLVRAQPGVLVSVPGGAP
jgi:predicted Zn-dependent peptidase